MKRGLLTVAVLVLLGAVAHARSVPPLVNYQGMLTDSEENPLIGTKKITFNLYESPTVTTPVWGPQVFDNVPLIGGRFNVIPGTSDTSGRSLADSFGAQDRYLGISVDTGSELAPRQQMLSTPFALNAQQAATAEVANRAATADVATTVQGAKLYVDPNSGNVGIGTTTPEATLQVRGTVKPFGACEPRSLGTAYQALTDGFAIVSFTPDTSRNTRVIGLTDSNNPPNTEHPSEFSNLGGHNRSFTMPVRKGDYWRVVMHEGATQVISIYWIGIGNWKNGIPLGFSLT